MSSEATAPLAIATYVGEEIELRRLEALVASLRHFGGSLAGTAVDVYVPGALETAARRRVDALAGPTSLNTLDPPEETAWFYLAGKVHAAEAAERAARGRAERLALLDPDTVFLDEPAEYRLPPGTNLGYRPTFHRNVNPRFDEPLDEFWRRAYERMGVEEAALFPMTTPAHSEAMRPYFQAGCVVVRPERGLFAVWRERFERLARDSRIVELCEAVPLRRVFTFQVALAGAVLTHLGRDEMAPLSDAINYPLFFERMFGPSREFRDLSGAVTIRYEHFFDDPPPGWERELKGPADRIAWLSEHFARDAASPGE